MQIKNAHIAKQTNHFTIDEIYSTNNMDNKINRSTNCLKFHYETSIALAKDTKRKKHILDKKITVQSAVSANYSPINKDTNNPYHLSIFINDQYAILLENIQSNSKNSAITNILLYQNVVKEIINLNALDICTEDIDHPHSANNKIKE